jgi:hypothetical protein
MPNECNNYITIKFKYQNERVDFENDFLKNFKGWDKKIIRKGTLGIVVRVITDWEPNFEWLKKILNDHPDCWIKDDWIEEGGIAGVWIGQYGDNGIKFIDEMKWNDLCIEEMALLF